MDHSFEILDGKGKKQWLYRKVTSKHITLYFAFCCCCWEKYEHVYRLRGKTQKLSTFQVIKLGWKRKTGRPRKVMGEKRITKRRRRWSWYEDVLSVGYTMGEQFLILCKNVRSWMKCIVGPTVNISQLVPSALWSMFCLIEC